MTTIVHKRGTGIPAADDLAVGEIAIDTSTGTAYTKNNAGEVVPVGGDSGGGGGDSIWNEVPQPNSKDYRWVTLQDQSTGDDQYGFRIQYSTRQEDPDNPDPDFPNGPYDNAELRIRDIKASRSEIASGNVGNLTAIDAKIVEQQIFGGIQILGADAERPDGLPYSPDEKSVQYALTVGHETLGRTVVIDKEGIIRARDFTDLDGNSIIRGDVDLSTYVTTDPDIQDGEYAFWGQYNKFKWIPDIHTGRGGKYWVEIGQGVGEGGAGSGYAALYIENSAGSFEVNYYSVLMTSMDLIGQSGSKISGFESVQAADFLDADGNSIIGPDYIEVDEEKKVITVGTFEFAGDEGNSVAVGMKSFLGGYVGNYSVGVGVDAKAFELSAAIGYCSEARTNSVAVGQGAQAWKSGVAIGNQAGAIHDYSVAIGENASTEETSQVMFGTTPNASYGTPLNLKTYGTMQASDYLDADGNPATVSPSAIVEAFTTLRDEIVKEDNAEDAIATLADTLGDLIRKFEGMSK